MGLYGYIIQNCLYFVGYIINGHKFATAVASMEKVNHKFVSISRSIDVNFATSLRFWIFFEILFFVYCCLRETMSVLPETRNQSSMEFAVTIFAGAVSSMIEIYAVVLYLIMSSLINMHYKIVNQELYVQLNRIGWKANFSEKFGKILENNNYCFPASA